jgi:hypothetical protein
MLAHVTAHGTFYYLPDKLKLHGRVWPFFCVGSFLCSCLSVLNTQTDTYGIWGKYWFRDEKNEKILLLIFTF